MQDLTQLLLILLLLLRLLLLLDDLSMIFYATAFAGLLVVSLISSHSSAVA